jgi:hypothetical protein
MKTAIIYDSDYEGIFLYIVEGNYKHLHGVYIGTGDDEGQEELYNIIYRTIYNPIEGVDEPSNRIPSVKDWQQVLTCDYVIQCGELL